MAATPAADLLALLWFVVAWLGYTLFAGTDRWSGRNLSAAVNLHRLRWMHNMVERENRITDASLVGNLMRSVAFLASTTILILGGLVALLGAFEQTYGLVRELPFAAPSSRGLHALKVLVLGVIFVYAFFTFTWSLRQFNYANVLIGAAPPADSDPGVKAAVAKQAARVQELGARSFNSGLRAYYFALATLVWFVHPLAFAAATAAVLAVLYRREFRSRTLTALRGE